LAAAIATTLEDPQESRQFAQGLRQRVRAAFSAELMIEQVLAAYRQVS
jgi:glycosyltransferase involved in cell wall biosynthesis